MGQTKYTELVSRWEQLRTKRSPWIRRWREISTYVQPVLGEFLLEDSDRGLPRYNNIYDSTATQAHEVLAAGLMSNASSPARPWFRLQTPDPSLNTYQPVKVWLDQVSQLIHKVFQKSNNYRAFQQIYEELGAFGTGCSVVLQDFDDVIHHYPLTCGEYCIATNAKGEVDALYRRFRMTPAQMVKEFGFEKCSSSVQGLFKAGTLDQNIWVQHAIEPRSDRDPSKRDAKNMAWGSWYFEVGNDGTFLRESGFKRFPVVAPRWRVSGAHVYGTSPAMACLGDIKQLQHYAISEARGIDYQTNPPIVVPVEMKDKQNDWTPGGVSYATNMAPNAAAVKNAFDVQFQLQYLLQSKQEIQMRVQKGFFADLFLMASQADPRMTATEVAARQEEKMLMLGPVSERLDNELFAPMIKITFDYLLEAGAIPPPPQEMQGAVLSVEMISVLAQAQKAINTNSTDRFITTITAVAQLKPEVLDKVDTDALVDSYGDQLGVDPTIIIATDKVMQLRDARAKAQAAQAQAAIQEQNSKTAANLAKVPTSGPPNAASDVMNVLSGYTSGTVQ